MARFSEVLTIINGKNQKSVENPNGKYPIYGSGGIMGRADDYICEAETVVIGRKGSINKPIFVEEPFWNVDTAFGLAANRSILLPKYLYYFCEKFDFEQLNTTVTIPSLTKANLLEIEIGIPSLETQSQIVAILDRASGLIALRKQQLAKLDELVKARFAEMFGDLKSNSLHWPLDSFAVFAEIDGNMTTDFEKYADYPHIGIDSIEKETGELHGYRTVKQDMVISGKYIFTPEHIIYSKIRPNLNKVALPTFSGLCSADAYPILVKREMCSRVFLAFVMRSKLFLDYILQFSSRTNLPKVNRKEIMGFKMPLPPLDLQKKFEAYFTQVEKQKLTIQQGLDKLEMLKKALMQEYFGEGESS